jgi:LuxR family maltose regulon positive regulatory protein
MAPSLRVGYPSRPLLAAKYSVPPGMGGVVRRRLHDRLTGNGSTRLTVVTAPAGWGKSTLLSEWAHDPAEERQVAWVSLDESDDEPVRFWTYVLAALQPLGVGAEAFAALDAQGADPVDLAVPILLNELTSMPGQAVLVLDDYHLLADPRLHESVEFLLTYLPPSLRLVLAGRVDPPLALARMRARRELSEIRVADLGFSLMEAEELLAAVGADTLDADVVSGLCERTEGWAAGLQLAALALRTVGPAAKSAPPVHCGDRHILDYFSAEVLTGLRPEHRDLLVRTSVLDLLSGPLCDAALERSGCGAMLSELSRADLFVTPLDEHQEWFRCHRLFRDALRHHLDPGSGDQVQRRAAVWFLREGYLADAVRLRITGGDHRAAAELLRSSVPWFVERATLTTHLQLGDRIDEAVAHRDPALCLSLAWAAGLSGQFSRMRPWLDRADACIDDPGSRLDGWQSLRGAAATLRAVLQQSVGDVQGALTHARAGVDLEADAGLPGYVLARFILGHSLLINERAMQAVPVLADAWRRAGQLGLPTLLGLQAASDLAQALFQAGRLGEAAHVCARIAADVDDVEQAWGNATAPGVTRFHLVQGRLALRKGDVPAALTSLHRAETHSRSWAVPSQVVMVLTALAAAELAAGDRAAARVALSEAREAANSDSVWPFVLRDLEAAEVRVGRGVARSARLAGLLSEELTDRELAILRMLPGSANQREIGAAMFLSINTVKGYTKGLYRKLDVATRQDAVARGRALGLI